MLRYIKHNLTGIDGVEIYPIFSLLVFIIFFSLVILFVMRMKKSDVETMSAIPLEDGNDNNFENNID